MIWYPSTKLGRELSHALTLVTAALNARSRKDRERLVDQLLGLPAPRPQIVPGVGLRMSR